jgi:putative ABC transport system permease protein
MLLKEQARDAWTFRWLESVLQDVRFAVRGLRRSPAFTAVAILTLSLSIGANTSIFSVVNAVLLRPLPFPEPDRLVYVWEVSPRNNPRNVVSAGNYLDWRERATMFDAIGARTNPIDRALTGFHEPIKIETVALTPSMLDVLRVSPAYGRGFTEADGQGNAPAVGLLAYDFWRRRFNADRSVVGQPIRVDGSTITIVGVMPEGFALPDPDIDLWTNLRFDAADRTERRSHNHVVLGRLRPGVDVTAADAGMDAIARGIAQEHPQDMTGWSVNVVGAHADIVRDVRPLLVLLLGIVIVVQLLACANLANLQLARATGRVQEMAVRAALGAGTGRLFRQLLVETAVLSLLGGGLGVGLAELSLPVIVSYAPADTPLLSRVDLDPIVLGVTVLVTIASALLVGVAPSLRLAHADTQSLIQRTRGAGGRPRHRLRHALLVCQVGLALVLLVAAALMVQTFWKLNRVESGFNPAGVLTVALDLPAARYPDPAAHLRFYDLLVERLRALPGVAGAAGTSGRPGSGAGQTFSFAIEGRLASNPTGREDPVPLQSVTQGYFETMRIPIVSGRVFRPADRADAAPVVVINEALARRHWPRGDAVGARMTFRQNEMPWYEIVGVVGDTRDEGLSVDAPPTIYVPFAQRAPAWRWMSWQTLVVRAVGDGDPLALIPDVRATIWSIDADLPLLRVSTVEAQFAENEGRRRVAATLLAVFACVAVLLGVVGVYGVMSYLVSAQRQAIAIRLALGATSSEVAASVVRRGVRSAGIGILLGLGLAAVATRLLETLLYDVTPTDPTTFVSMAALLLAIATLAAYVPARRATKVDPLAALRCE